MSRIPAQKVLVDRYLDWATVERRLDRYPAIASAFPLRVLKRCASTPPYFCHYMAWRLGTWKGEDSFELVDGLLAFGARLRNWPNQTSLLRTCDFSAFWSLLWQLQVARFLADACDDVAWLQSGPDLQAKVRAETLFVECCVYTKSFGIDQFVVELFDGLDLEIRVEHSWFLPFSLPKNARTSAFLDKLFEPFLDASFLSRKQQEARECNPVLLPVPSGVGNFRVWLGAPESRRYEGGILPNAQGIPEHYLHLAIREAVDAKRRANKLGEHRPNMLAINFALSKEFQVGWHRQVDHGWVLPSPDFGSELDAVLLAWCGINEIPTRNTVHLFARDEQHPARVLLGSDGDVP